MSEYGATSDPKDDACSRPMPLTFAAIVLTMWNILSFVFAIFGLYIPVLNAFNTWTFYTWFGIVFVALSTLIYAGVFVLVVMSKDGRKAAFDVFDATIRSHDVANFISTTGASTIAFALLIIPWSFFTSYTRYENLLEPGKYISSFTGSADPTLINYSGLSARGVVALYASLIATFVVLVATMYATANTLMIFYMNHPPKIVMDAMAKIKSARK